MGNKRRKDKNFKIGESMPGTVGDSKGTYHDDPYSPMVNIHNRRDGELMSKEETDEFLNPKKDTNHCHPHHPPTPVEIKSAKKWGHYWSDEQRRKFLDEYSMTAEELGWEKLKSENETLTE